MAQKKHLCACWLADEGGFLLLQPCRFAQKGVFAHCKGTVTDQQYITGLAVMVNLLAVVKSDLFKYENTGHHYSDTNNTPVIWKENIFFQASIMLFQIEHAYATIPATVSYLGTQT